MDINSEKKNTLQAVNLSGLPGPGGPFGNPWAANNAPSPFASPTTNFMLPPNSPWNKNTNGQANSCFWNPKNPGGQYLFNLPPQMVWMFFFYMMRLYPNAAKPCWPVQPNATAASTFQLKSTPVGDKGVQIETNKYLIEATGKKGEWTIKDKATGETLKNFGDPHFQSLDANGKIVSKSKKNAKGVVKDWTNKDMTFLLPDGTRITGHAAAKNGVTQSFNVYTPDGQYVTVAGIDKGKAVATYNKTGGVEAAAAESKGDTVAIGGGGNSLYEVNQDLNKDGTLNGKIFGDPNDPATIDPKQFFDASMLQLLNLVPNGDLGQIWDLMAQALKVSSQPSSGIPFSTIWPAGGPVF